VKGHPRGVGEHPHKGFETVTIVYDGEVSHRDSSGGGGTIGTGEVQWMTAGAGVLRGASPPPGYPGTGGPFRVVNWWVISPGKDKRPPAKNQATPRDMTPEAPFAGGLAGIMGGGLGGERGPATTFTPINLWDVRLEADAEITLPVPDGHTTMVAVLSGHVTIDGKGVGEAEIARLTREGSDAAVKADGDAMLLVMTGEPINEPVFGYGPFVMNTEAEIRQAIADFNSGRFGALAPA